MKINLKSRLKPLVFLIISLLFIIGIEAYKNFIVCSDKQKCFSDFLQQGINYETNKDYLSAIQAYQNAAKIRQDSYIPYSNLGSIYEHQKQFFRAEDTFKKALELDSANVSVYRKLYDLYRYNLKKYPDFMGIYFKNAMEKTNNDLDIIKLYATYLEDVNDPESSLAIWKSLLNLDKKNALYAAKVNKLQSIVDQQKAKK